MTRSYLLTLDRVNIPSSKCILLSGCESCSQLSSLSGDFTSSWRTGKKPFNKLFVLIASSNLLIVGKFSWKLIDFSQLRNPNFEILFFQVFKWFLKSLECDGATCMSICEPGKISIGRRRTKCRFKKSRGFFWGRDLAECKVQVSTKQKRPD